VPQGQNTALSPTLADGTGATTSHSSTIQPTLAKAVHDRSARAHGLWERASSNWRRQQILFVLSGGGVNVARQFRFASDQADLLRAARVPSRDPRGVDRRSFSLRRAMTSARSRPAAAHTPPRTLRSPIQHDTAWSCSLTTAFARERLRWHPAYLRCHGRSARARRAHPFTPAFAQYQSCRSARARRLRLVRGERLVRVTRVARYPGEAQLASLSRGLRR